MSEAVGPIFAAGFQHVTKSGYELLYLPDLHNDELQLKRLKKRKLLLKDQITRLESQLIPDLNA